MTYLELLRLARQRLQALDPADPPKGGLCNHLAVFLHSGNLIYRQRLHHLLQAATKVWPEFSGDPIFPVPDPTGRWTPEQAFFVTYGVAGRYSGEYGAARLRLRDHWVKTLDEAIAAEIRNGSETQQGEQP